VLRLVHRSAYMHKLKALSEVLDIYKHKAFRFFFTDLEDIDNPRNNMFGNLV